MATKEHCDFCDVVLQHGSHGRDRMHGQSSELGEFSVTVVVWREGNPNPADICAKCQRAILDHRGILKGAH